MTGSYGTTGPVFVWKCVDLCRNGSTSTGRARVDDAIGKRPYAASYAMPRTADSVLPPMRLEGGRSPFGTAA